MKKRLLSLILAVLFTASLFTGCVFIPDGPDLPAPAPAPAAAPADPAKPSAPNAASAELDAIDREIFTELTVCDALSYRLNLADPSAYPRIGEPESGWGEFSFSDAARSAKDSTALLKRLYAIDPDELTPDGQLTRATLIQCLEWDTEYLSYYYYGETLDTMVGLHSNLPLNMIFYPLECEADIEGYLTLLEDTPRYFAQVLAFEEEKSAHGTFMTDDALDEVISQLQDVIDSRETLFLRSNFAASVDELDLTAAQRDAYINRNDAAVDGLVDAYIMLRDGLEKLRGTCTNTGGLCNYGEEGLAYFELMLKEAACTVITPEEAREILQDEIDHCSNTIYECMTEEPDVYDKYDTIELTVGSTEENLTYLEELMAEYYPALPEHSITFMDCPPELEDQFSPAAYLIPPVDDASENLIILNAKTLDEDTRYLDTLAHEGYPGHMYHYQYIRTLKDRTGLTRQSLGLTGYYECWSQAAELFFDEHNTRFSKYYCLFMNANSNLSGLYLPALYSIEVNYYGATEKDLYRDLLNYYTEEDAEELAGAYYRHAVENPFYFLEYAMGNAMFQQQLRKAQKACGRNFDLKSYNRAFLDIGPTYFNFIMPVMDEWIKENR